MSELAARGTNGTPYKEIKSDTTTELVVGVGVGGPGGTF